jgi:hypothetical protein
MGLNKEKAALGSVGGPSVGLSLPSQGPREAGVSGKGSGAEGPWSLRLVAAGGQSQSWPCHLFEDWDCMRAAAHLWNGSGCPSL